MAGLGSLPLDHQNAGYRRSYFAQGLAAIRQSRLDVGSFVATGAIAVTAALTSSPALGAASGLLGMVGLPNLKDLRSKFKELAASEDARKNSVTGLLFRHVK